MIPKVYINDTTMNASSATNFFYFICNSLLIYRIFIQWRFYFLNDCIHLIIVIFDILLNQFFRRTAV